MLTRAEIRNFQSIRSADLELGGLTVVVGPSNSGKSALLRAIRTLAENAQSTQFVTTGRRTSTIALSLDSPPQELAHVALERGRAVSTYRVTRDDETETYAKSGKEVPEDVREILGLATVEEESLSFASQFDRPFLLSEPSTKVAKVLGDLTNINVLFAATREANRRKIEATSRLRVRAQDLERARGRIAEHADLPARLDAARRARETLEGVSEREADARRLATLIEEAEVCELALEALPSLPEPKLSADGLGLGAERFEALRSLLAACEDDLEEATAAGADAERLSEEIRELEGRHDEKLAQAGTCPLCGQTTAREEAAR